MYTELSCISLPTLVFSKGFIGMQDCARSKDPCIDPVNTSVYLNFQQSFFLPERNSPLIRDYNPYYCLNNIIQSFIKFSFIRHNVNYCNHKETANNNQYFEECV
jgi:hypothetical protein